MVAIVQRGTGMPVVFLHGYPLHHAMWAPQLEILSSEYHVILLDLPGFGLAEQQPVPETLVGFAQHVHRSITELLPGPVVVVGHSFGGYIALQWYREHPEIFRALVLTDTRSSADSPEAREKRMALVHRLEDPAQSLDVEETTRGLLAPTTWERGGALVDQVRTMVRDARRPALRGSLRAMADRSDLTEVLSTIAVPTLVVWGEEDHLIPPNQTESMVTRIPSAAGVGIPSAGHLPSMETPTAFGTTLGKFLDQVSSRA
jgi:pimeloyl-ACP methyl ester carboxylesterase